MPIPEEPMSDSLKDVEDVSLRFSIEGDVKINGESDAATRQKQLIEAITRMASSKPGVNYCPGRRQWLFVIAVDCYNSTGDCTETFHAIIKNVMQAANSGLGLGRIGFVLLTGLTLQETIEALKGCQVNIEDFDALACKSGSEMYYPWRDMVADVDYETHVEYRWPGENVQSMVTRLARIEGEAEDDIVEYVHARSSRCYSYSVRPGAKVRKLLMVGTFLINGRYYLKLSICLSHNIYNYEF